MTIADLPYRATGGWQGVLDIHLPAGEGPHPVLLYFHGGGWRVGSKASVEAHLPHFHAMGLAVVAPSYRLVDTAPAPAAAEDARAALDWLVDHAAEHDLDPARILVGGHSAGGNLALCTAYAEDAPRVAGVIAWSAHSDLAEFRAALAGTELPVHWLDRSADPEGLAERFSPLRMVRPGLPPAAIIHSDRDPRVPYSHATRLAGALAAAAVPHELVTMRSDGHLTADQPPQEVARGHACTHAFLAAHGIVEFAPESVA